MQQATFWGEISNPFNILRQNFEVAGNHGSALITSKLFVGTFLVARLTACPYFGRWTTLNPHISQILKLNVSLMRNIVLLSSRQFSVDSTNCQFGRQTTSRLDA